ncbi:MAG TPA: MerR family transcriptional regulator [Candidatus Peribacteraceae bacterium]|nr:MerR family transcriptional regulator [Candidatus Peribacteraceae bacterium]
MNDLSLKIGELSKRTGVTERTLRHYDEIGLLTPGERTDAGYRLYNTQDIERLQRILSLQSLGFSLENIQKSLDDPSFSPLTIIEMQLQSLNGQLDATKNLMERLSGIARFLQANKSASTDDILTAIEMMNIVGKYHTPEQMEDIRKRGEMLGDAHIKEVEAEWPRLIAAVKEHMAKGSDPSDQEVKKLAKRWGELVHEFTGGNPQITENLKKMYQQEQPTIQKWNGPDPGMMEYIRKASET